MGLLHIADRLHRSACGSPHGEVVPFTMWRWKPKTQTCSRCARIYQMRRGQYTLGRALEIKRGAPDIL
jgi:hypothetical protein